MTHSDTHSLTRAGCVKTLPVNTQLAAAVIPIWAVDGVDHININSQTAQTELGKMLATSAVLPFTHPILGSFTMIEGFWFYVKTQGKVDDFRVGSSGSKLRKLARKLPQERVDNFHHLIMDAMYEKIVQNQPLLELFLASELPFVNYFISGRVRVMPPGLNFMNSGLISLREIMRAGAIPERPDYSHFTHLFVKN